MARPREFDVDDALNGALQIFWTKGYEGTGITDLLNAMKIARGSLYKAFGDKKGLFIAALKQYETSCVDPGVELLQSNKIPDGTMRIQMLFDTVILAVENDNDRRGCFLCNTAVDQAPHDTEISKICQQMMEKMVEGFYCALEDIADQSDKEDKILRSRAMSLNVAYNGLRVMAKAGYPPSDIKDASNRTLIEFGLL
ncbi:TetR/AcrR family transcriptional regulator [Kiloniella litopenaei]|uniref:TetR/AcrR family transcriptional regulator n=1 Tax=Kiloniella litopenaei TaxID=1549748 RepID=UPI0006965C4B|nr:TetR/AcrR family transcriptional regulator [Kiloniella litopenaei]